MSTPDLDLWRRASHAQMGRGLDRANSESMQLRGILDDEDPIHVAFLSGAGYILGLVYAELEYQHRVVKTRDFARVTDQALSTLANLKEATMPVVQSQVDQKLTELGIDQRRTIYAADFGCHLFLRAQGLDSRYSGVAHHVTVPFGDYDRALRLKDEWLENRTDPVADGRKALRLWGRKEAADA